MKKKILFLSFALLLVLIAIKGFDFFYKRDISFRLVCELPDILPPDWGFLPASYKFIHTEKDFDLIPEPSEVSKVLKKMNLDFKKHSYLLTCRKKLSTVHYSPYCARFQSTTLRKFQIKGEKYVCVEYEELFQYKTFLYEVDRDERLSGHTGPG